MGGGGGGGGGRGGGEGGQQKSTVLEVMKRVYIYMFFAKYKMIKCCV